MFRLSRTLPFLLGAFAALGHVNANTVQFQVELTWETASPDGYARKVALMNGQSPGPLLELQQGDDVEFLVVNSMPFNTTLHFHGIEQLNTIWSDGVPGLTQWAIQPGESFLYKWTADQYGSYWYHGHARGQIDDGLFGPIYIHPRADEPLPPFDQISDDEGELSAMTSAVQNSRSMTITDWRHDLSADLWTWAKASGVDLTCSQSILVNGKGSVVCPTEEELADPGPLSIVLPDGLTLTPKGCVPPTSDPAQGGFPHDLDALPDHVFYNCTESTGGDEVIEVDPSDGWVAFNVISGSGLNVLAFSIDEHPIYIYAVDGRYIEPYMVHYIYIEPGARYSVLVKLDKPIGDYTIRVYNKGANQILKGTATLTYTGTPEQDGPSTAYIDRFGDPVSSSLILFNPRTALPFGPVAPAQSVDDTFIMDIGRFGASHMWTANGVAAYPEPALAGQRVPLLFAPETAQPEFSISTNNGTWVDIIFQSAPMNPPHPLHKHSNKVFVLGSGVGEFTYSSVAEAAAAMPDSFNFENPILRDIWSPPPALDTPTWVAVRYQVVNPGPVFLHCHMQIHMMGGMAFTIMDGIDAWPEVPPEYLNGGNGQ